MARKHDHAYITAKYVHDEIEAHEAPKEIHSLINTLNSTLVGECEIKFIEYDQYYNFELNLHVKNTSSDFNISTSFGLFLFRNQIPDVTYEFQEIIKKIFINKAKFIDIYPYTGTNPIIPLITVQDGVRLAIKPLQPSVLKQNVTYRGHLSGIVFKEVI